MEAIIPDTGEIVSLRDARLGLPGRVLSVGLELPDSLSFDEWQGLGERLKGVERSLMWWIGDWLRFGERKYGEMYAQAVDATDKSYETLKQAVYVAGAYELCDRSHNLSWTHHLQAASLPREERAQLLRRAEDGGFGVREIRAEVNRRKNAVGALPSSTTCTVEDLKTLAAAGKRFGCIYADPPWLYDNQGTRAATGNHYGGMTIDELCAMPVGQLAAENAHLHLWTTNAFLFECPRIFDAWGFEFRSSFVWCKPEMGIGNYWRNSHEILLSAIRGDAKKFRDKSLMSWLECSRGRHSAKPEQVRHMIEKASTGPFLELFARSPADGWTVWGNQIERGLLYHDVGEVA